MITKRFFDSYNGVNAYLYTLYGENIEVDVLDFGAAVYAVRLHTKSGVMDVALHFPTIEGYVKSGAYCGATVGRIANRIGGASFSLDGKEYSLSANEGNNQLHGGKVGFSYRLWEAEIVGDVLKMTLKSEDGAQGYPNDLTMTVEYELVHGALEIRYSAISDGNTVWAPTNHTYFNLDGEHSGDILSTKLKINAERYTILDAEHISTGEVAPVKGTPFDFTSFKEIGKDIDANDEQLLLSKGYDCNFMLQGELAAIATSSKSGITLSVYTDLPGLQFYSGNYLEGTGKTGEYHPREGFCLEPQYIPNAVNLPQFAFPLLKANEKKTHYIRYQFTW